MLLRSLLQECRNFDALSVTLDERARPQLRVPAHVSVRWVSANLYSRLSAEISLLKSVRPCDVVFCFHGLPPLLPTKSRVTVFLQNRLYLDEQLSPDFNWKIRLRLTCERLASRLLRSHVSNYIVQTPSMQRQALQWMRARDKNAISTPVSVVPFVDLFESSGPCDVVSRQWDFVYVASGDAHKNHRRLLAAWLLLAQAGIRPSLALTLSKWDSALQQEIATVAGQNSLLITDLGMLSRADVLALYGTARALIFPSTSESFGLPLIEATRAGLPIIAGELDFVRDVCEPVQTFDPTSAESIARAVKRFLEVPESPLVLRTPAQFWDELLQPDESVVD